MNVFIFEYHYVYTNTYYQIYIKVVQQKYGTTATLIIEANIQKMFTTFANYESKSEIYIHIHSIYNVLIMYIIIDRH